MTADEGREARVVARVAEERTTGAPVDAKSEAHPAPARAERCVEAVHVGDAVRRHDATATVEMRDEEAREILDGRDEPAGWRRRGVGPRQQTESKVAAVELTHGVSRWSLEVGRDERRVGSGRTHTEWLENGIPDRLLPRRTVQATEQVSEHVVSPVGVDHARAGLGFGPHVMSDLILERGSRRPARRHRDA